MSKKWLMWLGCGVIVLVGGYLLWSSGYRNILSYGMLLLCPLMHLFMMGGHDHGGHGDSHRQHVENEQGDSKGSGTGRPACH